MTEEKTIDKLIDFLSDKLETQERQLELAGKTIANLINNITELKRKTEILHRRLRKIENKNGN